MMHRLRIVARSAYRPTPIWQSPKVISFRRILSTQSSAVFQSQVLRMSNVITIADLYRSSKDSARFHLDLADDYIKKHRFNDACQSLASLAATEDFSTSKMANLLCKILSIHDRNGRSATIQSIDSIYVKFQQYEPVADLLDPDVIRFYTLLARSYAVIRNSESAKEILNKLHSPTADTSNLIREQWRQLEIGESLKYPSIVF